MRLHRRYAYAAVAGLALLFCTAATAARAAETVQVAIEDFAFTPAELTVKAGTTVIWTNKDDEPHLVVSTTGVFQSAALDTDEAFRFTFNEAGSFTYFCSLHPHMKGTVTVTPGT
jgi:plastocyanin